MSREYGVEIAESFEQYLKTGNSKLIEGYSIKELKAAVSRLSPFFNNNKLWYRELENRVEELSSLEASRKEELKRRNQSFKEKWLDRIVAFGLGLLGGVLIKM